MGMLFLKLLENGFVLDRLRLHLIPDLAEDNVVARMGLLPSGLIVSLNSVAFNSSLSTKLLISIDRTTTVLCQPQIYKLIPVFVWQHISQQTK